METVSVSWKLQILMLDQDFFSKLFVMSQIMHIDLKIAF